ncbi:hypothetical protein [Halarcobacter ebronensis]|nr:hypothetical protein [Halarcobacter ebronensis]QKF81206.1 hypothetical protein AEBR_0706 [Halarcobacter ebronensis]
MFESEISLSFIIYTIVVILMLTAIGIIYVNKKSKKVDKEK